MASEVVHPCVPRKPQSGEGSRQISSKYVIRFPGRRLAGPRAAPRERKPVKRQKESAKSHSNRHNGRLFALSYFRALPFFTFQPSGRRSFPGEMPANIKIKKASVGILLSAVRPTGTCVQSKQRVQCGCLPIPGP